MCEQPNVVASVFLWRHTLQYLFIAWTSYAYCIRWLAVRL